MLFKTASEWASLTIRTGILTLAVLATLITLLLTSGQLKYRSPSSSATTASPIMRPSMGLSGRWKKKGYAQI